MHTSLGLNSLPDSCVRFTNNKQSFFLLGPKNVLTGSLHPLTIVAKVSIQLKCKIQLVPMNSKRKIALNFIPQLVTSVTSEMLPVSQENLEEFNLLFHHHQEKKVENEFLICQKILPCRTPVVIGNDLVLTNQDLLQDSTSFKFSELLESIQGQLENTYNVIYQLSDSNPSMLDVRLHQNLSVSQKLMQLFYNIPQTCTFSWTMIAQASIHLQRKIILMPTQFRTNYAVSFVPDGILPNEHYTLLYQHGITGEYLICQSSALQIEIPQRTEVKNGSNKKIQTSFSNLTESILSQLGENGHFLCTWKFDECFLVEVSLYGNLSFVEKFKKSFAKIEKNGSIVFVCNSYGKVSFMLIKLILQKLGRKAPINALDDPKIISSWISNEELKKQDIITKSEYLEETKTENIIELSDRDVAKAAGNAIAMYTLVKQNPPRLDENISVEILSSKKHQSIEKMLAKDISQLGSDSFGLQSLIGMLIS